MSEPADLQRARDAVRSARSCAVLTGAGASSESGIPTFRGSDGLWSGFRAEDLATPEAFARDPERVLAWYEYRRELLAAVRPNAGHFALVGVERLFESFALITQNVDGLHESAGSRDVIELHGNVRRDRCHACGRRRDPGAGGSCSCGGKWRPDVVWFGELLPAEALSRAFHAAETADLFISAGTSSIVYPAAALPFVARESGAMVIEVNTAETPLSRQADLVLRGRFGEIFPMIFEPPPPVRGDP